MFGLVFENREIIEILRILLKNERSRTGVCGKDYCWGMEWRCRRESSGQKRLKEQLNENEHPGARECLCEGKYVVWCIIID
jgi:hypothetical protein